MDGTASFVRELLLPGSKCRLKRLRFLVVHRTLLRIRCSLLPVVQVAVVEGAVSAVDRCILYSDRWEHVNLQVVVHPQKIVNNMAG